MTPANKGEIASSGMTPDPAGRLGCSYPWARRAPLREPLRMADRDRQAVLLFGASGHGRAVADVLARLGIPIVALVDPAAPVGDDARHLDSDEDGIRLAQEEDLCAVVAVGNNSRRVALARRILVAGVTLSPIVARTATVHRADALGPGSVVMEHGHVGPGATCGLACIVNTGATVEHDCRLADGVHCAPASVLGGGAKCDAEVLVGTGSVLLPMTHVGATAVVGAGAVVTGRVRAAVTVIGVPAREMLPRS